MKTLPSYICAAILGFVAAYIDLHTEAMLPPIFVLMIAAGLLSVLWPARAWVWALVIGLAISVGHIVAPLVGYTVPYPVDPPYSTLIALIPAFIGAYAGAGIHKLFPPQQAKTVR